MLKTIFVCENSPENEVVKNLLLTSGGKKIELNRFHQLEEAVEHITSEGPVHLAVIDVDCQSFDPAEIAETCLDFYEDTSFIFVGNSRSLSEKIKNKLSQDVLGSATLVELPLQGDELEDSLVNILIAHEKREELAALIEADEAEFAPLKLRSLYLFKELPVDAYLKLSPTKFMRVIDKGTNITQAMIQNFAKRKVKNFHLYKDDQVKVLEEAIIELYVFLDKYKEPKALLENLVRSAGIIHAYLRDIGTGEAVIELMDKVIEKCDEVYERSPNIKDLLKSFPLKAGDAAEKSILTAMLGCCLLNELEYKSATTKSKIILTSLLCDSTLENEDLCKINSVADPNLRMFSEQEQSEFNDHPHREGELASLFTKYPEVDFILREHHEQPDGSGFPNGIRGKKITLISAIFNLTNEFSAFMIQRGINRRVIEKAIESLEQKYSYVPFRGPYQTLSKALRSSIAG